MKYQDALFEIIRLWGCSNIVVTGPQRSGTTIVAHALAHDLCLDYVDEDDIGWIDAGQNDEDNLLSVLDLESGLVIQSPACAHICHTFPLETVVVFVMRDVEDIVASQERIDWQYEDVEQEKYPEGCRGKTAAETKYTYWAEVQQYEIEHAYEIEYESLRGHPLWRNKRDDFGARQWK